MRKLLLIVIPLLLSVGISQNKVNINNLVQYGDKMFEENDDRPYTGKVFDLYKSNGNKKVEGYYRKGIKNGKWTYYTEIGNGKYKVKYTDGTYTVAVFTDSLGNDYTGLPITDEPEQDGTYLYQEEDKYDFSKFSNIFATIKDGELDGLFIYWYENGQKSEEGTYKDGELIDSKYWDEDGKKRLTPPIKSADEYYSAAQIERNAKNTKASLENLDNLIKHYPEHALAPQAQYLMGDIYMNDLMDFQNAINSYGKVSENFVGTNRAVEAQFMVGYIYANILDDIEQAVSTYQTFLEKFPDHELAPSVKFELENMGKSINDIPALKNIPN